MENLLMEIIKNSFDSPDHQATVKADLGSLCHSSFM